MAPVRSRVVGAILYEVINPWVEVQIGRTKVQGRTMVVDNKRRGNFGDEPIYLYTAYLLLQVRDSEDAIAIFPAIISRLLTFCRGS